MRNGQTRDRTKNTEKYKIIALLSQTKDTTKNSKIKRNLQTRLELDLKINKNTKWRYFYGNLKV